MLIHQCNFTINDWCFKEGKGQEDFVIWKDDSATITAPQGGTYMPTLHKIHLHFTRLSLMKTIKKIKTNQWISFETFSLSEIKIKMRGFPNKQKLNSNYKVHLKFHRIKLPFLDFKCWVVWLKNRGWTKWIHRCCRIISARQMEE